MLPTSQAGALIPKDFEKNLVNPLTNLFNLVSFIKAPSELTPEP